MIGQALTVMEASYPRIEQWLVAACWAVHKLDHYTMYLPHLEIGVPQASLLTVLRGSELHCKVAAVFVTGGELLQAHAETPWERTMVGITIIGDSDLLIFFM